MKIAPLPAQETDRLDKLLSYGILDTDPESCYDDLTKIASEICQTPIALVSLVDAERQWFKSRIGLDASETHRDLAFCAHAILERELFLVEDALLDERFADNPLVTGGPTIRFYAGTPLVSEDGYAVGTLCVIDREPRQLTVGQQQALQALGRQISCQLELRLHSIKLQKMSDLRERLLAMLSHDVKSSFMVITGFAQVLKDRVKKLDGKKIADSADRIEHASKDAHALLESILDWSRNQLKDKQGKCENLTLRDICDDIDDQMTYLANSKCIKLHLDCPTDVSIVANRCLLHSALHNLVSNAIKFSHADSDVNVTIAEQEDELHITVTDQGVGMEPELAKQIFYEDSLHSSTGTKGEMGTGIGTLLINDFVRSVGGKLVVDTAINKGCSVCLKIPQKPPENITTH